MSPLPEVMVMHLWRGEEGSKHMGGVTKDCREKCIVGLSTEFNRERLRHKPHRDARSRADWSFVRSTAEAAPYQEGEAFSNLATRVAY